MRSVAPCDQTPEHCFIARFGLLSKDRRKFYIAWEKVHKTIEIVDGYLVVKFILGKFSDLVDEANTQNGVFPEELTSSFIKTASLMQVFYECAVSKEEANRGNFIDMVIVSLEVSEDGKVFAFPLEKFKNRTKEQSSAIR
jgi:hypothetical protein